MHRSGLISLALAGLLILGACSSPASTTGSSSGGSGSSAATAAPPTAAASSAPAKSGAAAASPAASGSPAASTAGAPTTPQQIETYAGSDRQQVLENLAKKEGKLSWYTSLAGPVVQQLVNGFEKKYPYVKADVLRAAENELVTKATQEAQAGQQVFDALESPPDAVHILADAKLVNPYYSPAVAKFVPEAKDGVQGNLVLGTTVRVSYIGFGYNTKLLPASAVPKTTQDLLNPALKGKLALAGSTTGYRWVGSVLKGMGQDQGTKFLQQLAQDQKPSVQQTSAKALLDLIIKGEFVASPNIFQDHVEQAKSSQHAPVEWVPLEPVVANTGEVAVATKAPHPAAAMLFADYLLTDGQAILKKNGYSSAADKPSFKIFIPEQGRTTPQMASDLKSWTSIFKTDFR